MTGVSGSWSEAVYRLALRAYPRDFRRMYGADMVRYFRRRRAELGTEFGVTGSLVLARDIAGDLLRSVPREHLARRRATSDAPSPGTPAPEHRAPRGDSFMTQFLKDLALAVRGLAKRPTFAATVVVTLALGIGANAAVFSIVNGVLLAPLPYPDADRLVRVWERNSPSNAFPMSVADYRGVQQFQRSFEAVSAFARGFATVTGGDTPERVRAIYVTAQFFDVLGRPPEQGRGFLVGEDEPGADLVVVLGHSFAVRHFDSAEAAVGRAVTLDGRSYAVVGVMAPGVVELAGQQSELWPIFQVQEPSRRGPFFLTTVARLADGATLQDAQADMVRVSEELFPLWADSFQDRQAKLFPVPLREAIVGDAGNALGVVFGAVGFVLLVAVANVANLMLTRAAGRRRELAVRSALGAGRGNLLRWLLAESVVLTTAGGLLGLLLAVVGVEAFKRATFGLPRLHDVGVDAGAVGFAALLVAAASVLFGAVPLISGGLGDPGEALRSSGRGASASRRARFFRNGLVVAEFALTLPLLVAAGLLVNTLNELQSVEPGFDPHGVVTVRVGLPGAVYPDQEARRRFWTDAMASAREIPGVVSVSSAAGLPPDSPNEHNNFDLLDQPVEPGQSQPVSPWSYVTSDFFETLGVSVQEGRAFDGGIDAEGPPVLVVSRAWSERYYPGDTALGKQLLSGGCTTCEPATIVGIVDDVKYRGLEGDADAMYQPAYQWWPGGLSLVVKTEASESATLAEVRRRLRELDPDLPLGDAGSMNERIHAAMAQPRHWATLLGSFATAALALAAIGIFGVLSYSVRRQTREIGVRMALGADAGSVRGLVVVRGMRFAALGVGLGLAIALYATRWLESLLFGVSPTDTVTLVVVSALLLGVALVASYVPARRAAAVDPIRAITAD